MSSPSSSHHRYRQAIVDLYKEHDPAKVSRVDELLQRFVGQEEALLEALKRKFSKDIASADEQASASNSAAPAHVPVTLEDSSYSGPPPNAPLTMNISIKGDELLPPVVPEQPALVSFNLDDAMAMDDVAQSVHRTPLRGSYGVHAPLRVREVDHEPGNYNGQGKAQLCTMEKQHRRVQTAEGAEGATGETSLPVTVSLVEAGRADDYQGRSNDEGAGYEVPMTGLRQIYETSGRDAGKDAELQPQSYPSRDEASEAIAIEYDPEPVGLVMYTEEASPVAESDLKEHAATAPAKNTDPMQTPAPSAQLPIWAMPEKAQVTAKRSVGGTTLPALAEMSLGTQTEVEARSATSQDVKLAAVGERVTEHKGSAADAAAAGTEALKFHAAALELAMPPYNNGAPHASSPPHKRAETLAVTHDKAALAAVARPLQAASAKNTEAHVSASRLPMSALPMGKIESPRTLVLDSGGIVASLSRAIRRTALFDVTFYDFFRVLGSFHAHGRERVSLRVAGVLLSSLFPEISRENLSWRREFMSSVMDKEAGMPADEMRELIVQGAAQELQSHTNLSNGRIAQFTHSLVLRMEKFVKTCRMAVVQLQRKPHPLSAGFWAYGSVLPRAAPHWKRYWAKMSVDSGAISLCYVGSLKTELHIPFGRVARCYRERNAAGAPPVYARNGLAFQLTTDTSPLLVVVCPESSAVTTRLLSAFRSWSSLPRDLPERSTETHDAPSLSPVSHLQSDVAESSNPLDANQMRVWVFVRATSTYELQRWWLEDTSMHMLSDHTRELHTCSVADVESVVAEIELPVTPRMRQAHGFVLCFRNGSVPLMAFTELPQDRARLLERLYQSQVLLQVEVKTASRSSGGG
ncbi:hypothetical protein, conserved [Leishmania tarentolae]|uniref:Uncharacterized protein n=1 Tax=Leishmania tarentolae TaxID=5689 RepID=A0A640KG59_LEITA|nr:hypothetical protein, conserved [Leishmania tarentolae]